MTPKPVRVVLADDEELVLDGLTTVLQSTPDIEVVGRATDGSSLLVLVAEQDPDVVLVDVRMPGLDGLAALERLPPVPPPYRAVLTTFGLDDYVDRALDAGAHGFLLKDAAPEVLVQAVRDLAAGGAVIDPRIAARLLPRLLWTSGDLSGPVADAAAELSDREREVLMLLAPLEPPVLDCWTGWVLQPAQAAQQAGVPVRIEVDEALPRPEAPELRVLRRMVQEGVANAVRHGAGPVTVTLTAAGAAVVLRIRTRCRRAPRAGAPPRRAGPDRAPERVAQVGGTVQAGSTADGGWLLEATVPGQVAAVTERKKGSSA